jgi:hypothetical protein
MSKLKALVQWFMALELQEHNHWCLNWPRDADSRCQHQYSAWSCKGVFCANTEHKNCPTCEKKYQAWLTATAKKVQTILRSM